MPCLFVCLFLLLFTPNFLLKNERQADVCLCERARRIYYRVLSAKEYKWNRCEWQWRCIRKFPFKKYVNDTFGVRRQWRRNVYVAWVSRDTIKRHSRMVLPAASAYIFSRQLCKKSFRCRIRAPIATAAAAAADALQFFIGRFCENIRSNVYLHFIAHTGYPAAATFWLHNNNSNNSKMYVVDTPPNTPRQSEY